MIIPHRAISSIFLSSALVNDLAAFVQPAVQFPGSALLSFIIAHPHYFQIAAITKKSYPDDWS